MKNLNELEKRAVFKALAVKSQYKVGLEFGFDKWYPKATGVINAVNKIYREVKEEPEKFSVGQEVLDLVEKGMSERRTLGVNTLSYSLTTTGNLEDLDERTLVLGAKKKSWVLLNRKLDHLMRNKKSFRSETTLALAKLAGIVFDKAQILRGEATEHIALKAKIDENISVHEAVSQLLKFRESNNSEE